jgi:hypothetical protein
VFASGVLGLYDGTIEGMNVIGRTIVGDEMEGSIVVG